MTRFNHHAVKFEKDGQAIIDKFIAAQRAKEEADAALSSVTRRSNPQSMDKPTPRELFDAKEAAEAAGAALESAKAVSCSEAKTLAQTARESLEKDINEFYSLDSDKVDANFQTLIDSGVMTDADVVAAFCKYDGNGTMLRIVANEAKKRVTAGSRGELADRLAEFDGNEAPEAVIAKFDSMGRMLQRFAASDYSPHWHTQIADAVASF